MRKQITGILLILCVIFSCVSCAKPTTSEETQPTTTIDLQIVYKNNQFCYSIIENGNDTSLYMFNAAAQPIFDIYGLSATAADLAPGMKVSLEYDGYVLETYPLQFSGVSSIRVTDLGANNVEFLSSMISGMFPSSTPSEIEQWEVTFSGDEFLNAKEKHALEYFLNQKWEGAAIKVEPTEEETKKNSGRIAITTTNNPDETVTLKVNIASGLETQAPMERTMTVHLEKGKWTA
ncbi:MAG: hypothetical protein IK109_07640 [Clostridiales bacterium]|nr:hypothetical protein [Clostridiales bacterium]